VLLGRLGEPAGGSPLVREAARLDRLGHGSRVERGAPELDGYVSVLNLDHGPRGPGIEPDRVGRLFVREADAAGVQEQRVSSPADELQVVANVPGEDRRPGSVQEAAEVFLPASSGGSRPRTIPGEPEASTGGSSTVGVKLRMYARSLLRELAQDHSRFRRWAHSLRLDTRIAGEDVPVGVPITTRQWSARTPRHSTGCGPALDDVAEAHQPVGRAQVEIGEQRVERDGVAVDIGEQSDQHER
jgi:hypothetical protein